MYGTVKHARQVALTGALALLVAACGGASGSAAPSAAGGTAASQAPGDSVAASQAPAGSQAAASAANSGTGNAIAALSDLSSYKIKFAMASKGTASGVAAMGNITMAGIVVAKPEKATDITMSIGGSAPGDAASAAAGMQMRIVEVKGKSYVDLGGGLTESTDASQSSVADSLSPDKLLGSVAPYLSQMKSVGDEQKNGVSTTHYQADAATLATAAAGLEALGLANATWSWDVWVAKEGGYAVSYVMKGAGSDSSELSIALDVSDVNSASNVVTGP